MAYIAHIQGQKPRNGWWFISVYQVGHTSGPQLPGGWGFIAVDGGLVSEARPPIPAPHNIPFLLLLQQAAGERQIYVSEIFSWLLYGLSTDHWYYRSFPPF